MNWGFERNGFQSERPETAREVNEELADMIVLLVINTRLRTLSCAAKRCQGLVVVCVVGCRDTAAMTSDDQLWMNVEPSRTEF
jgi:hypothetical protein